LLPSQQRARHRYARCRDVDGQDNGPLGSLWRPNYIVGSVAIQGYTNVPSYPASTRMYTCVHISHGPSGGRGSVARSGFGLGLLIWTGERTGGTTGRWNDRRGIARTGGRRRILELVRSELSYTGGLSDEGAGKQRSCRRY